MRLTLYLLRRTAKCSLIEALNVDKDGGGVMRRVGDAISRKRKIALTKPVKECSEGTKYNRGAGGNGEGGLSSFRG